MLAKLTSKNQITIPKQALQEIGRSEYFSVKVVDDAIILQPVDTSPRSKHLETIRKKVKKLGLTEKDIASAIQWSRKHK